MKHNQWRLIESGLENAQWNMAVDEALLSNFKDGDLPILRLYRWEPSLSLGRFSKPKSILNIKKIAQDGFPFVRRISGGGVLVHGKDISYGLILSRDSFDNMGVKESYSYICKFIIELYKKLGHTALFASQTELETKKSDVCLAGIEPYDIVIKGKKIGGNAQRYSKNTLLQHGSIPISVDEAQLEPLFIKDSGLKSSTSLEKLGTAIEYNKLIELVKEAFCESFNVTLVLDRLSLEEKKSAKILLNEKYTQNRWNIHAN